MAEHEKTYLLDIIDSDSGEIVGTTDFTITIGDESSDPPGYGEGIYPDGEYGL